MTFQPGRSGNPAGRKPGSITRLTVEVRELSRRLFDASYWKLKYDRIHAGLEHPKIESLLLAYAFGSPQRDQPVTSTIIQLGPLEALQQAQAQLDAAREAMTLSAETIALPDVTDPAELTTAWNTCGQGAPTPTQPIASHSTATNAGLTQGVVDRRSDGITDATSDDRSRGGGDASR